MIMALLCAVISVIAFLMIPILIGNAVDYIVAKDAVDFSQILKYIQAIAVLIAAGSAFQWLMTFCTNKITYRTIRDLRKDAFNKLNSVPLSYIDAHSKGNVINTVVNDIDIISDGLLQGFAQLFTGIITILGTLCFMISINIKIAILVVALTPLSLFLAYFISKLTYNKFKQQSAIRGELTGYAEEMIENQKLITAFMGEEKVQEHFEEVNERMHKCGIKAQFYSSLTNPSTRFVNSIVYAVVGMLGAVYALGGIISIGQLSCFLSYANQYMKPFNEISGVVTELQAAIASAKRVFDILDAEEEVSDADITVKQIDDLTVNIKNVEFSYSKEKPLIKDFNLTVKPGQRVAIVGPTGCGKTTFINLLMRFYDVQGGSISIGGVDIRDMKRSQLRNMFGMVLQDTWLFSGTIRENISYGNENVSDEDIIKAAKMSHAHNFIMRLPDGYDTVISEEGGNISQGQKQLLCITRIMLSNPPILILDEATSNIDTRTEIRVQRAFSKMMQGRTSFVVAHRLSTIMESDIILVMKDGNIIEQGNHYELMEKEGFYCQLYLSQFAPV
ncbi:MAG: ABC transporter ATP-binding protein [Eubacterium sp.]